jgi:hypothetical protein
MLWDPKKDKVNGLEYTLDHLISWLETMPPEETYSYSNSEWCALCQFLKSQGHPHPIVNTFRWGRFSPETEESLPLHFDWISSGDGSGHSWSYGAMLERAKVVRDNK